MKIIKPKIHKIASGGYGDSYYLSYQLKYKRGTIQCYSEDKLFYDCSKEEILNMLVKDEKQELEDEGYLINQLKEYYKGNKFIEDIIESIKDSNKED